MKEKRKRRNKRIEGPNVLDFYKKIKRKDGLDQDHENEENEVADSSEKESTEAPKDGKSKAIFQYKWLKIWEWMRDLDAVFCSTCESFAIGGNNKFAKGGSRNFKTSTYTEHAACNMHITAEARKVDASRPQKPVVVAIQRMHESVDGAVLNLFRVAYTIAARSWSFSDFQHAIDLLEDVGCSSITRQLYHHDQACQEFVCCIAESLKSSLVATLKASPFFGVQVDESTDIATQSQMVLCISYLVDDCEPKRSFLGMLRVKEADAGSLFQALLNYLESLGLDMSRFVGFGSDGASTMTGQKTGVATRLKERFPFLTSIHCIAHRANLAVSDAGKMKGMDWLERIETLVNALASHFSCSSKRLEKLQGLLEEYACDILRLERIQQTRWLSRHNAISKVCEDLPAILKYSQTESRDIFAKLADFQTIYLLHYLADILGGLTILSKLFQADYVDVTCMQEHVDTQISAIRAYYVDEPETDLNACVRDGKGYPIIPDYGPPSGFLAALRSSLRGNMYREFTITRDEQGLDLEDAIAKQKAFANAICQCLETRFEDASVLKHFKALVPIYLPRNSSHCKKHGHESLEELIKFYGTSKSVRGSQESVAPLIDGEVLRKEYSDYKIHAAANWHHKNLEEVCLIIASSPIHKDRFKSILTLLQIPLVQCASNAICESVFSTRTSIKDRWRPRLGIDSLNACIAIVVNGPKKARDFDFQESIQIWKKKADRHIYTGDPRRHLI